jgi:hypothetical protein
MLFHLPEFVFFNVGIDEVTINVNLVKLILMGLFVNICRIPKQLNYGQVVTM